MDDHLPQLERVIAFACRRARMSDSDSEDFGSFVKRKLIENDYAILRKYQGDSELRTFLATVVHRLLRDYRQWRPTADA